MRPVGVGGVEGVNNRSAGGDERALAIGVEARADVIDGRALGAEAGDEEYLVRHQLAKFGDLV